jgi:predicted ATP-dependent endonuclease of OLD family
MSHIISFQVEGLAGRKKPLEIVLNRDVNIFFGLNGCGKTSLLKILHSAMSNTPSSLIDVPFKSAKVEIYSMNYDRSFTRSITKPIQKKKSNREEQLVEQYFFDEEEERIMTMSRNKVEMEWTCTPKTPKLASETIWAHEFLPTSRIHINSLMPALRRTQRHPIREELSYEDELDAIFAKHVELLWRNYSTEILGIVRNAQQEGLANILSAVLSPKSAAKRRANPKLTAATAYARAESFLKRQEGGASSILGKKLDFEARYKEDATLQQVVGDIDAIEEKIEKAMASRNKLQNLITRMFTSNKEIRFTDDSIRVIGADGEIIGLKSLSSGEKHLLRILVETLRIGSSSLIIDEPEISMHIDWQKDLISSLQVLNSEAQLILATHSPEVMADISNDKIFII